MPVTLNCHPDTPCPWIDSLSVTVGFDHAERLVLHYDVLGQLEHLCLPEPATPKHTDGLWRNTCFEAFFGFADSASYVEANFSPSSAWALYRFDDYRANMRPLESHASVEVRVQVQRGWFRVAATLPAGVFAAETPQRVALTAVTQDYDGNLAYWAIRHPDGKPDFHHRDGFAVSWSDLVFG